MIKFKPGIEISILFVSLFIGFADSFCEDQSGDFSQNLVLNNSFEQGKKNWDTWGKHHPDLISIDMDTSTDKDTSIKLDGRGSENLFINIYQTLKLMPSTTYLLKADIRRTTHKGYIYAAVMLLNEKGKDTFNFKFNTCGKESKVRNVWEHFEFKFKTMKDLKYARVSLFNVDSNGIAWFDNICVLKTE